MRRIVKKFQEWMRPDNECVIDDLESENIRKLKELTISFNEHAQTISTIYEALLLSDDIIYISDINTYDIIWVNDKAKSIFGRDIIGKKCFSVFQKLLSPCSFCTNKYITDGTVYTWVFFNESLQRKFLIKDRLIQWDDNVARLEIAIDITDVEGC